MMNEHMGNCDNEGRQRLKREEVKMMRDKIKKKELAKKTYLLMQ